MGEDTSGIHYTDPFLTPEALREPVRRFRGRLASGVTVWTSVSADEGPVGLTISSIVIAEGEPSLAFGLIGDATDLFDAITTSERFVVHVLDASDKRTAEVFAGTFPSPGGMFAGRAWEMGAHGPVLADSGDRIHCRLQSIADAGYQRLVAGVIKRVELSDLHEPLVYFRGKYRPPDETGSRKGDT